jgi:hypothetical protein
MEKSKHFSTLNFNKPISSFFASWLNRKWHSLNKKVKAIEAKENDKISVWEIMMQIKCDKTQVYNTPEQKDKIMNEWLQGNG